MSEVQKILEKHGAEEGELTHSLRQALYDLLMEKMPKPITDVRDPRFYKWRVNDYNQGLVDSVSAINELFGRTE